jgi:hypothetical protein
MTDQKAQDSIRSDPLWYMDAIIYQTHVKRFFDTDGNGGGDFRGLTQKLDYIRDLGVNAIWLLPFYPSPMRDDGYDIADYRNIVILFEIRMLRPCGYYYMTIPTAHHGFALTALPEPMPGSRRSREPPPPGYLRSEVSRDAHPFSCSRGPGCDGTAVSVLPCCPWRW